MLLQGVCMGERVSHTPRNYSKVSNDGATFHEYINLLVYSSFFFVAFSNYCLYSYPCMVAVQAFSSLVFTTMQAQLMWNALMMFTA